VTIVASAAPTGWRWWFSL